MNFNAPNLRSVVLFLSSQKVVNFCGKLQKALKFLIIALIGIYLILSVQSSIKEGINFSKKKALVQLPEQIQFKSSFFKQVNLKQIEQQKIFGSLSAVTKSKVAGPEVIQKPKFNLVATFKGGKNSYAIIEDGGSRIQDVFEENESVFDKAKLIRVNSGSVVIRYLDGSEETLYIDDTNFSSAQGSTTKGVETVQRIAVSRVTIQELTSDLASLASQARIIPFFQDGKPVGLRIFGISSGSIFQILGLENGDIVKSVEGYSLLNPEDVSNLVQQLREKSRISVIVERNRQNVEIIYDIS